MSKRKVCVVVTARPSYSRVRTVLRALSARPDVELQLVVAASALLHRYGSVVDVIEADGFRIAAKVHNLIEGETLITSAKSTGMGIVELSSVFDWLQPDVVVSIADRFETLATAVAASYMNIPLAHIQGGEITGSIDEKVRHAVTKLADLHLASTRLAAERIVRMGEDAERVHWTGCPSIDIAAEACAEIPADFDPFDGHKMGVGADISLRDDFLLVMQHPVTTEFDAARTQTVETLEAIAALDIPTFWFWPNVDAGSDTVSKMIRVYREQGRLQRVHICRNLPPENFLRLLVQSKGIIGNSSVGIRECAFLGVPAVNIGSRQQSRERAHNVIDVAHQRDEIIAAIQRQLDHGRYSADTTYGDGLAGERISSLLASAPLTYQKVLSYR